MSKKVPSHGMDTASFSILLFQDQTGLSSVRQEQATLAVKGEAVDRLNFPRSRNLSNDSQKPAMDF